jgi:hypothetical protein
VLFFTASAKPRSLADDCGRGRSGARLDGTAVYAEAVEKSCSLGGEELAQPASRREAAKRRRPDRRKSMAQNGKMRQEKKGPGFAVGRRETWASVIRGRKSRQMRY